MIKTLSKARKQERVKFLIPRSVQDCIPIRRIWADGIFQVGHQFSKTWSFTDINYSIAGKDDKTAMFLDYCDLLNALASGASAKITLYNRRINKEEFERSVLLPLKEDGLDNYREEFNEMLRAQVTESNNSIVRERYLTISVVKRNIEEARTYFARVGTDLTTKLAALSSWRRNSRSMSACGSSATFSVLQTRLLPSSISTRRPGGANISKTGCAPAAWSSLLTISRSMTAWAVCSTSKISPAT